MTNFPHPNDEVYDIIKRPPEQKSVKALPNYLQHVFNDLNRAFYEPFYEGEYKNIIEAYRHTCKKVNWVRKKKLSSE